MEYNKLSIFYLALTEKECFRIPFELSFKRLSITSRCPDSRVNFLKQLFKLKVQVMEYTFR